MVRELDQPAQVHRIAHVGTPHFVRLSPEQFKTLGPGFPKPGYNFVVC